MTGFRRIVSLPYVIHYFTSSRINAFYGKLEAHPSINFCKTYLTQSRYVSTNKSIKDLESETEDRKQHDLFQLNYISKNLNESREQLEEVNFSNLIKKMQTPSLTEQLMRNHLFLMLTIFYKQRSSPDFSVEMDSFVKSDEFQQLTESLEQVLPMVTPKYLCLAFKVMHLYQTPCSSILMQKLHALILDNINNFDLIDIIKMYLLVKKNDEKLLEPLKRAFLAYMEHLTEDSLNYMGNIKSMIYYAANVEVPLSTREKMLQKILSLGPKLKDLDPTLLVKLSFPLCSLEFQKFEKGLYIRILEEVVPRYFQYYHLKTLLENLILGLRKKLIFYNKILFDSIALAATKCHLQKASHIMNILVRNGHVNYALADHIATQLIASGTESLSHGTMEEIICIFGTIDYKNYTMKEYNNNWNELETVLNNYIQSGVVFKNIQTSLSLLILELGTSELFSKALVSFMENTEEVSAISIKRAALLYQFYQAVYSKPPENVPENFLPNCISKIKSTCKYDWSEELNKAFNGEENVLRKCKSPFGTLISYVVILERDKTPLNLSAYKKRENENSDSFEDLIDVEKIERPPESKVFAFIECNQEPIKFRNLKILRPEARIICNIHKRLGYKTFYLYFNKRKTGVEDRADILRFLVECEQSSGEL